MTMKGKDPAFLFYPEAFLVGCMDMDDEEVGRYIRLLCKQHSKGYVRERDLANVTEEVRSKFHKGEDGNYYNARLTAEIEKRKNYTDSRRRNAGGKKKDEPEESSLKESICKTYATHMDSTDEAYAEDMQSICNAYDEHIKNKNKNKNKDINKDTNDVSEPMKRVLEYREEMKKRRST